MSSNDIAISVSNLSKCYHIYDTPRDRLKQFILPWLQRQPSKQYFREFWALNDVSFEVKKGETVGIIGRNGSGKSTLLQMICGTLNPSSGSIQTNGRIAALLELGSGFNPEFTGRENVRMSCALLGLTPEETEARFGDIAAFADIGDFIEQPVKTYSSGMYVRLAFAVNIVSNPDIMIVDEALSVGDMYFQAKCMTALSRIQKSGATVLFVSHDINAIKNLCSRAIFLEEGRILAYGYAPEVTEQYVRAIREELNDEQSKSAQDLVFFTHDATSNILPVKNDTKILFKTSDKFDASVSMFRYGTGEAKITYVEFLDENGVDITEADFDQSVVIKIHFACHSDTKISPGYYIQDDKKNFALGASWVGILGLPMIEGRAGDKFIVTYKTRLPLQAGIYSIQFELVAAIIMDELNRTLDLVDNGIVFKVAPTAPAKIWSRVYIHNSVELSEMRV